MSEETKSTGQIELERAIKSLWYWRKGGDSFSCMLYELAHNCIEAKREKLFKGFPYERMAYRQWTQKKVSEAEWFQSHGLRFGEVSSEA